MIDRQLEPAADERARPATPIERPERIRVRPAATSRVGRRGRLPGIVITATSVFLTLALVKPWAGPTRPRPLIQGSYPPATVTPTIAGSSDGLDAQCGEPLGWTVFTRERWNGQLVRAWRAVEPSAAADGPLDPAVPLIRVGKETSALGYCSPMGDDERPPGGVSISAWRIVGPDAEHPAAIAVTLDSLVPSWPVRLGALFRPVVGAPARDPSGAATWALGRYVFALRARDWERWWAVNIPASQPA